MGTSLSGPCRVRYQCRRSPVKDHEAQGIVHDAESPASFARTADLFSFSLTIMAHEGPYSYAHVASREHLEMTEMARSAGASAPAISWQQDADSVGYYVALLDHRTDAEPQLHNQNSGRVNDSSTNFLNGPSATSGAPRSNKAKKVKIAIGATLAILVVAGIVLALLFTVGPLKKTASSNGTSGGSTSNTGDSADTGGESIDAKYTGQSGSLVTLEDGSTFTYSNDFGGDWAGDPQKPFGRGGKAQSWSPRVGTEEWKWGEDIIRGVNLGSVKMLHDDFKRGGHVR